MDRGELACEVSFTLGHLTLRLLLLNALLFSQLPGFLFGRDFLVSLFLIDAFSCLALGLESSCFHVFILEGQLVHAAYLIVSIVCRRPDFDLCRPIGGILIDRALHLHNNLSWCFLK